MNPTLIVLLAAVAGLALGYGAALALARSRVELARGEARAALERQLAEAEARARQGGEALGALEALRRELAVTQREAAGARAEADGLARAREALAAEVADLRTQVQAQGARAAALAEAEARLRETFQALSAEALRANSEAFLQLAGTQMEGRRGQAVQDLEARQQAIAGLLQPLQTGLQAMDTQLRGLAESRTAAEAALGGQLGSLTQAQAGLQAETQRLASALRRPEVRGAWGEVQLRNVVEYAGMTEHVDFQVQGGLETESGRLRPDLLVRLPGGKRIAVDAKAPLQAYLEALEVEGDAREERLQAVAAQVRTQVKALGDKRYFDGLAESPDFVVLFLPLEALFATALQRDPRLLDDAIAQQVILASPTTLVALLKSAAYGWAQDRVQANAEEIQGLGRELLERVLVMAGHTDALRKALLNATEAFNDFAGSLESRVMTTAQRLQTLGVPLPTRRKPRPQGLHGPQTLHTELSGLPKLGIKGEPPALEADVVDGEED